MEHNTYINKLTRKELKYQLRYNPEEGVFTRIISHSNSVKVGSIAGSGHGDGYIIICVNGKRYPLHRLAWFYMTGRWPKEQIDHINHIKSDNRWINLREVNQIENARNQKLHKCNKSGFTGVRMDTIKNKWHAQISYNGERVHLGFFNDKNEAVKARKYAEVKYRYHENHGNKL